MHRTFIKSTALIALLGGAIYAQTLTTVLGTGDPRVDVPAVQAAVDRDGRVVLEGHFSFEAPPTVPEQPSILFSEAALGTIRVSKAVVVSGALNEEGGMTSIDGGANPFYVEAPGAHVTIEKLHFTRSKACVVRVVAARGLVIAENRIETVVADTNLVSAILISTSASDAPPNAINVHPENVSGAVWIGETILTC